MKVQLAIFRNQEATELFNYLVSYTRLIAKKNSQSKETCHLTLEMIPEAQKVLVQ